MRDDFTPATVCKVAERAAYICSNPSCNRITIGPSENNQGKSKKNGIAAHICAASPGGPRYDISQSPAARRSISNAIWLCPACASLIDKDGGTDYPAAHLNKWKKDHEELMNVCMEGAKRIVFQFLHSPSDKPDAQRVIRFLQSKGALFMPYDKETPSFVMESIKELRTFFVQIQASLDLGSPLYIAMDSMIHACRHYMNTTHPNADMQELIYGLGGVRKVIGINIGEICKTYKLSVTGPLKKSIPN